MKTNISKLLLCNAAQMFAGQPLSSLQVLKREKIIIRYLLEIPVELLVSAENSDL
jgi:hypothetical protein